MRWIATVCLSVFMLALGYNVGERTTRPEVYTPEPVISKCDSIILANDSLIQVNNKLQDRLLTFTLGLAQLKMVDKPAHDYLINAGNFKFIEDWQ